MAGNIFSIVFFGLFFALPIGFALVLRMQSRGKGKKKDMSREEHRRLHLIAFLAVACALLDISANGVHLGRLALLSAAAAVAIFALRGR